MDLLQVITGLGASSAAVLMAYMFLKDRDDERAHSAEERRQLLADRQEDRLMLSNHLSKTVTVLQELVVQVREHRRWSDGEHRRWTEKDD